MKITEEELDELLVRQETYDRWVLDEANEDIPGLLNDWGMTTILFPERDN